MNRSLPRTWTQDPGSGFIDTDDPLERLARRAAGDPAAFDALVRECRGRLQRWALAATGDSDEADDVVQETLLRMHRFLPGFRGDARFTTWLYRIVRSVSIDHQRQRDSRGHKLRRLFRQRGPRHQPPATGVEHLERQRQVSLVRVFLEELPAGQRQVFDLADLQGYRPAEIAEMMHMNPSTVRAHLFKARRAMRTRMLEQRPPSTDEASQ